MADTSFLKKHRDHYQVVVEVPKALRKIVGHPRLKRSLGTGNLAEANKHKHAIVAEFKAQIEQARTGVQNPRLATMRKAEEDRKFLSTLSTHVQEPIEGFPFVEREEYRDRMLDHAKDMAEKDPELASLYVQTLNTSGVIIKDHVERWLSEIVAAGQTKDQHRAVLKRFFKWAGELATFEGIKDQQAGEYVSHMLTDPALSRRTNERHRSSLSNLWKWAASKGFVGRRNNVWLGHSLGKKNYVSDRKAFSNESLLKLLNGVYDTPKYRQFVSDILRLDLLTGMRLAELCHLRQTDVQKREDGYWLIVQAGKTEAAAREVPLHQLGDSIIERRLAQKDEWLFPGLLTGGPDDKRSWYAGRPFLRFRKQVGVDGKGEVFHALRNTFTAMMEGEEVPESTVKLLIGHKRSSLTFGHYSKGERVKLRDAIKKLSYGVKVEAAILRNPAA